MAVLVILTSSLGNYGLAESSEARYAEISREMVVNGDYLNPELLGIYHFHKPPLTYYITTLGYQIFGINEFGARFFLQIAVLFQLLLVYRLANLLYRDKRIGLIAGIIYFSLPIVLISSRNLTTDAFLATITLAAIYCWQVYFKKQKLPFIYLFYLLTGVALFTKGPVALLFILVYIIVSRIVLKSRFHVSIHDYLGVLTCVAIGASWYVMVIMENPKLWDYFLEKQLLSRIESNLDSFHRAQPFWYYLPILFGLMFPWWIALIPRLKSHLSSLSRKRNESKILLYSSGILLILFSAFSTKLIMYILPIFWMPALFIAVEMKKARQKTRTLLSTTYLILMVFLLLGLYVCWFLEIPQLNVPLKTLTVITGATIAFLTLYLLIEKKNQYKPIWLAGAFGAALLLTATSVMAVNDELINSTKNMVRFIDHTSVDRERTVLVYDYLLPSISFYSNDNVITLNNGHYTSDREIQFEKDENWRDHLWNVKDVQTKTRLSSLSRKRSTYLLVRNKQINDHDFVDISRDYNSRKQYAKWTIFYNK